MADCRDGENVIHIIGGDVADNQGGKLKLATGYEDREASVDATFNFINDGVAMKRLIPQEEVFLKTKMCDGFSSGTFQNDTSCKFTHEIEDLRTPEQNYEEFEVAHQNKALLAKVREQFHIQPVGSSGSVMETGRFKVRHCKRFISEVGCPFGDQCTYIHDEEIKNRESMAIVVATRSKVLRREGGGIGNGVPAAAPLPARQLAAAATKPSLASLLQARAASNSPVKPFNWRTKICSRWEQAIYCPYENHCIFAHGQAELQRYGGGPVAREANPNHQEFELPSNAAASGSSVAPVVAAPGPSVAHVVAAPGSSVAHVVIAPGSSVARVVAGPGSSVAHVVAAPGSSVAHAGGSGQPSGAARRPWRGPNKISRIYGDWIDEE